MDLTATDFFCFLEYGGLLQKKHENAIITNKHVDLLQNCFSKGFYLGVIKGKKVFLGVAKGTRKCGRVRFLGVRAGALAS